MNKLINILATKRLYECRSFSNRLAADGKVIPKVKNDAPRITLISPDNSISITDLKNAQTLSTRRDLKLVKIQDVDAKTRRPVYKLMSNSEYHEEELLRRKTKQENRQLSNKGEKLLTFSTKIGEHDLMTNIRKMMKLLEKQYEVRVVIAGESEAQTQRSEQMYSVIEKNIKDMGKVVQKRNKGNTLRFQLLPSKDKSSSAADGSSSNNNNNEKNTGPL